MPLAHPASKTLGGVLKAFLIYCKHSENLRPYNVVPLEIWLVKAQARASYLGAPIMLARSFPQSKMPCVS